MHKPIGPLAALAITAALLSPAAAQAPSRDKVGTLTCDVSAGIGVIIGSKKEIACIFTPAQEGTPREVYSGTITKLGVDIGATSAGEIVWSVLAPSNRQFGALAGDYVGATAEATVGAGIGANVLIGGSNRTVALQPLSVSGQTGLNLAAGVAELSLRPAR